MVEEGNGWGEWKRLVLSKLDENDEAHKNLAVQLQAIHIDLASLKTSSRIAGAVAGFLAGAVVTIAAALIQFIK